MSLPGRVAPVEASAAGARIIAPLGTEAMLGPLPGTAAPTAEELGILATEALDACIGRGLTIATAESCTGGLVSHALTEVAGSSMAFRGGIVAYANDAKVTLLDVDAGVLESWGAVSAEAAAAMATGARHRLATDLAVAVTGVAGPDGGTVDKPVGLVYVCVAGPAGSVVHRRLWPYDRTGNKRASAALALALLREAADETPPGSGADRTVAG